MAPTLLVPEEAIVPEHGRSVCVRRRERCRATPRGAHWQRRPGDVEIVEGIAEGERVVVEGTQNMRDGTNVPEAPIAVTRHELAELSIRRPVFATVISLLLIIFGIVSLQRLPMREYPDIERPVVSIATNVPRRSAPVIETKVTQPIEDRIAGIEGIDKIESASADERSQIRWSSTSTATSTRPRTTSATASRASSSALPEEADPPEISKADAGAEPIMFARTSAPTRCRMLELTDYAERYIVDRFAAVPGVARVASTAAGATRCASGSIARRSRPAQLTVTDIENALRRENVELPAGRIESRTREFSLRTAIGLETADDFRNLVIGARAPTAISCGSAKSRTCELAAENERTIARTNRMPGVPSASRRSRRRNTLEVARGVRAEIAAPEQGPSCRRARSSSINIDNAVSIEAALHEVLVARRSSRSRSCWS